MAEVRCTWILAFTLAAGDPLGQVCGTSGNFTANSTYQANIQRISAALPGNASSSRALFATATLGVVPDAVYALALCRGDANASACASCVGFLPPPLHASDPDQHQATVAATARAHTMGMDMVAPRGSRSLPAGGARQRRRGRQGRSSIVGASPAATPRRRRPSVLLPWIPSLPRSAGVLGINGPRR